MAPTLVALLIALAVASGSAAAPPGSGSVSAYHVASAAYDRDRLVWVRTPSHYDAKRADGYDLLIAFDGDAYQQEIPLPRVLDSLEAAGRIAPTLAVLVDNASGTARLHDLANQPHFVRFLADELVPWVRRRWRVTANPHRVTLTGSSAGGLSAAYLAFQRPDRFGRVLWQSGAFWRGAEGSNDPPWEWLTRQIESTAKRDVTFLLDVGALESSGTLGGRAPSILSATRRLRDALKSKGYAVTYTEVEGGRHDPADWARRLPVDLATLNGRQEAR